MWGYVSESVFVVVLFLGHMSRYHWHTSSYDFVLQNNQSRRRNTKWMHPSELGIGSTVWKSYYFTKILPDMPNVIYKIVLFILIQKVLHTSSFFLYGRVIDRLMVEVYRNAINMASSLYPLVLASLTGQDWKVSHQLRRLLRPR